MGIFQLDLTVKTAIELGIDDMRQNPWLIDHMLDSCVSNPYLKDKYGQKQIDSCREWFLQNKVEIYMRPRNDKDKMPCITITPGNSPEKDEMKHMGDASTESVILMPQDIGKPIPYIIKPFVPAGYSMGTGVIEVPDSVDLGKIAPGMIVVDPDQGQGFVVLDVTDEGIQIESGIQIDATRLAVVPQFAFYKARVEHTFFQQSLDITCYAHGDPQVTVWLHSIALYSILRYRESLLEAQGFAQSSLANGPLQANPYYSGADGEQSFMQSISLTGQVENTWIKSPRRFIENIALKEKKGTKFVGGIKILSNTPTPPFIDPEDELWYTVPNENTEEDEEN